MEANILNLKASAEQRKRDLDKGIKDSLDKKMDKLLNSVWSGGNELPEWFIEYFRKSFMDVAPKVVQMLVGPIEQIATKKVSELTVGEVGVVINYFANARPNTYVEDFETALMVRKTIDPIMQEHTALIDNAKQALYRERDAMYDLYDNQTWMRKTVAN